MTTSEADAARSMGSGSTASALIDVLRPVTWPPALLHFIDSLMQTVPTTEYAADLDLPDGAEDQVRSLTSGLSLRAYHATRLLDHEHQMISEQGLRVFSRDLFEQRIHAAYTQGAISEAEHLQLLDAHMYATGEQHTRGHREGKVCVILSEHACEDSPSGLRPLLSTWGGEGIYFSARGVHMQKLLRVLGKPAMVEVAVPILPATARQLVFPHLAQALVGAARGLRVEAELHHPSPIPGVNVIRIWQPGDSRYDHYSRLPQT